MAGGYDSADCRHPVQRFGMKTGPQKPGVLTVRAACWPPHHSSAQLKCALKINQRDPWIQHNAANRMYGHSNSSRELVRDNRAAGRGLVVTLQNEAAESMAMRRLDKI
jgi:hypothetical protein